MKRLLPFSIFVQKIIEKAAEEKIKDLVPKKNSTRSFCNIMRLVW